MKVPNTKHHQHHALLWLVFLSLHHGIPASSQSSATSPRFAHHSVTAPSNTRPPFTETQNIFIIYATLLFYHPANSFFCLLGILLQ
jgi:hypothetical protein